MLLAYNNIINNINYIPKVFLNLRCVLNVLLMLYSDIKYLPRLDELINSTTTAKQLLRMNCEGLSSPKEPGRKKRKLKGRNEDDCLDNFGIDVEINIPEIF